MSASNDDGVDYAAPPLVANGYSVRGFFATSDLGVEKEEEDTVAEDRMDDALR